MEAPVGFKRLVNLPPSLNPVTTSFTDTVCNSLENMENGKWIGRAVFLVGIYPVLTLDATYHFYQVVIGCIAIASRELPFIGIQGVKCTVTDLAEHFIMAIGNFAIRSYCAIPLIILGVLDPKEARKLLSTMGFVEYSSS